MSAFPLCNFIFKLCTDVTGSIAYVTNSLVIIRCILIAMVIVDVCFFPTWLFHHKKQKQRKNVSKRKTTRTNSKKNIQTK